VAASRATGPAEARDAERRPRSAKIKGGAIEEIDE